MEKKETIKSVMFLLSGALLQLFNGVGDNWRATLVAIFGIILFIVGLTKLKKGVDSKGQSAATVLLVGAIIGLIGSIIFLIPLIGIVANILFIITFIILLVGYIMLGGSKSIGASGKTGTILLLVAMILGIIESILGLIPLVGAIVGGILGFVAVILIFFGWLKILEGILAEGN